MKKAFFSLLLAVCPFFSAFSLTVKSDLNLAADQCLILASQLGPEQSPRTIKADSLWRVGLRWWCSGFFPGTCWYISELTGREDVKIVAIQQTDKMLTPSKFLQDHDAGFQAMCSLGSAYKFTKDERYLPAILESAEFLAKRFSPVTKTIKSWDNKTWQHPVIIDNMMNLELLTFAAKQFNRPEFAEIAKAHAFTTMKNHFREDYSTWHLVDYNSSDGTVLKKQTVQGYADDSSWSRGQAWALYGYTMMFRETGEPAFLEQAEHIAGFLLPLLAKDPVPVWDFNAPKESGHIEDASAAAIMASAFVELSTLTKNERLAKQCLNQAKRSLSALSSSEYFAKKGELKGFLLKHSTGYYSKNSEVDVPLTYADYYYAEALWRLENLK